MGNTQMKLSDFSSRLPYSSHLEHDSKSAADLELWNHPQFDSALIFLLNPNLGGAIITNQKVHQGNICTVGFLSIFVLTRMDLIVTVVIADVLRLTAQLTL